MNTMKTTLAIVGISFFLVCVSACDSESEKDTVAVLITAWGQPSRYVFEYSWDNHYWGRIGDTSETEDQKCKIGHVGEIIEIDGEPYSQLSHLGIMPWGFNHVYPGDEEMYDDGGFYYQQEDGMLKSIHPDLPALDPDGLPADAEMIPTVEIYDSMAGVLQFPPDPRTDIDLLQGWFKITGAPNGECDANELNNMIFMYYYKIMQLPTEPWLAADIDDVHLFYEEKMAATKSKLQAAFGDQIDVRDGYYTAVPGYTKHEVEVAREFAQEGFRKMLVSRETTDNNNYANEFMVLNYVKEELCEQGVLNKSEVYMTRQIGRTPEYNAMNVQHVRPYIETYPKGSTIAMIYITHGLSWPGGYSVERAMSTQHPWWKEVMHENSFLNYLAWKEALITAFGEDYDLVFSVNDSDNLLDSFYAYGYFNENRLGDAFNTVRYAIQLAKQAGADKMIAVPAHWHGDAQDTQYIMRHLNNIPLVPIADMQAGNLDLTYCEDADDNDVPCASAEAVAEITVTRSYNDLDDEFATVYATRLRGGIERFGVYPTNVVFGTHLARKFTKKDGGTIEVKEAGSNILGAKIVVPKDPSPEYPEAFTPETAIPFSETNEPFECMWNDTKIVLAHRTNPPAMESGTAVGPAVHFGPYRLVFNCNVTLTVPYSTTDGGDGEIGVSVYNHLTKAWEPVAIESAANGLVTFKTQYLGLFQASSLN